MPEEDSIKTTVNARAKYAYECVKNVVKEENENVKENYKSYSKRLMAMIKINGLAATMAFIKASFTRKKDKAYELLYKNIDNWLKYPDCPVSVIYNECQEQDMVERIISFKSDSYRIITKEVMEFINWVRRFAEGMITDDSNSET